MQIIFTDHELEAFLILKRMTRNPTLPNEFFEWIAARLIDQHGESPNVDYVQALRRYSDDFDKIITLLNR